MRLVRLALAMVILGSALMAPEAFGKGKSGTLLFHRSLAADGCDYQYTCSNGSSGTCCSGLANCCDTCGVACGGACGGLCPVQQT